MWVIKEAGTETKRWRNGYLDNGLYLWKLFHALCVIIICCSSKQAATSL